MSDNSSDTPTGVDDSLGEPSMEDILASIRRIIAEDDSADHGHVDVVSMGSSDAVIGSIASAETSDLDDILVLEEAISEPSTAVSDVLEVSDIAIDEVESDADFNPVSNVMSDLEEKLSGDTAGLTPQPINEAANEFEDIELSLDNEPFKNESIAPDLNDSLLDEIVMDLETIENVPDVSTPDDSADVTSGNNLVANSSGDSDLDLVKSLMAELTDSSFVENDDEVQESVIDVLENSEPVAQAVVSNAEDIDALVSDLENDLLEDDLIESVSSDVEALDIENELDSILSEPENSVEEQEQILSDILDMAIKSEEDSHSLENLELAVEANNVLPVAAAAAAPVAGNALLQIAAQAEADAKGLEVDGAELSLNPEGDESTEDILSELDQVLAEVVDEETDSVVEELKVDETSLETEIEPEIEEQVLETQSEEIEFEADEAENTDLFIENQETEDMAKTARKDAILDEVTETAAADAFASLNQAVEENAIFTESGPRIGELVQDALRPMLKEWLDENLKTIVERAVTKEVKRIASGK